MRNYIKEDALFLRLRSRLRGAIANKLFRSQNPSRLDYTEITQDVLHDCFLEYRRNITINELFLEGSDFEGHKNATILSPKVLTGYLFRILFYRVPQVLLGRGGRYFEHVPNRTTISLEYLIEEHGSLEESFNNPLAVTYVQDESTTDVDNLIAMLKKRIPKKEKKLLDKLLEGDTISEVSEKTGTSFKKISVLRQEMGDKLTRYLKKELLDLKEGLDLRKDRRGKPKTLNSIIL